MGNNGGIPKRQEWLAPHMGAALQGLQAVHVSQPTSLCTE